MMDPADGTARYRAWSTSHLTVEPALPGVLTVGMARPPVNAMSEAFKLDLLALTERLAEDEDIRAVVFASVIPGAFSAGSDLFELAEVHAQPGAGIARNHLEYRLWEGVANLPQATIAAIDGFALGGGLEFAVACDLRVAAEGARFSLPEISIGGTPGIQILTRLTYLVGDAAARRLLLFGEGWTAQEARAAGLVDHVVADGEALQASLGFAEQARELSPTALRFIKGALARVMEPSQQRVEAHLWSGIEEVFRSPEMVAALQEIVRRREERKQGEGAGGAA